MSDSYMFDMPKHQESIIKVIGVGGGGSNAVNHMYNEGIKDVEFVVCNTDSQALNSSPVPTKLQIGIHLTEGLGAGANPEVGRNAAMESKEDIRELLSNNTKMVFITAGMGGGTGTGAAPVIAQIAKDLDILTVGIVTSPFSFEGRKKMQAAQEGINQLKNSCDTVLVILNDKLREIYGNLSIRNAFSRADNVLSTGAKSIAEIITVTSEVNVDFEDVKTVMRDSGPAVMGSASAEGENRAKRAVQEAISSPLLNNTDINGAKKILLSITYGEEAELSMDELTDITDYIEEMAGDEADVIFGQGVDTTLGSSLRVTVIATGFKEQGLQSEKLNSRTIYDLESNKAIKEDEKPQKEEEDYSFKFEKPKFEDNPEPKKEPEEPKKVIFDINGKVSSSPDNDSSGSDSREMKQEEPDHENSHENRNSQITLPFVQRPKLDVDEKKKRLQDQARERVKRLEGLNKGQMDPDEFRQRLDIPAYKRKNVSLNDVPHSSEKHVSKYNLNDDNEIMGNNRFLHDNVD